MIGHGKKHPWAGKVVEVRPIGEHQYLTDRARALVVDWADRITVPWQARQTEDAVLYATRVSNSQHHSGYPRSLPSDSEVILVRVYGEVDYLVHQSEISLVSRSQAKRHPAA